LNLCGENNYFHQKLHFGYKTGSIDVLMKFVEQNYGYTLVPYLATLDVKQSRTERFREFKEPTPKREISLITPEGYLKNKLIDTISEEIRNSIPKELRHLDNGKVINWKS